VHKPLAKGARTNEHSASPYPGGVCERRSPAPVEVPLHLFPVHHRSPRRLRPMTPSRPTSSPQATGSSTATPTGTKNHRAGPGLWMSKGLSDLAKVGLLVVRLATDGRERCHGPTAGCLPPPGRPRGLAHDRAPVAFLADQAGAQLFSVGGIDVDVGVRVHRVDGGGRH